MMRNNKIMGGLLMGSMAAWGISRMVKSRRPWYRTIGKSFSNAGKMVEKMAKR